MLVSIIITNRNYASYLPEAIESALNQSYADKEIIVVDDGSTDHSARVIANYGGSITPVFKKHGGHCSAANAGLSVSRGDILMFLDADDYLLEHAVETLAEPLTRDRRVSKSQAYLLVVGKDGKPLGGTIPRRLSPSGNYRQATLSLGPAACHHAYTSGNAWSRWFVDQVMPLPEELNMAVDGCLNSLSALFGRIESIEQVIGAYRVHNCNKGPVNTRFSPDSLRYLLERRARTYDHLADWAERLGYSVPVDVWHRLGGNWQHGLMRHSLALMDGAPPDATFRDLVMSPFNTGHTSRLKAVMVCALLSTVWVLPRQPALAMARRMLQLPRSG